MDQVAYFDSESGDMKLRDCTPEEQAEINERRAAGESPEQHNAPILAALAAIDAKSIRALREGDAARIASLAAEAIALRLQLRK